MAKVGVRLLKPYKFNNAGELCGFPEEEAKALVADGVAAWAAKAEAPAAHAPAPAAKPAEKPVDPKHVIRPGSPELATPFPRK